MNLARIYLDNAATTPLRAEAAEAMRAAHADGAHNPSSLHAEGRRARSQLDRARDRIAAALGARRTEVTFTGGGTESDNLALIGVARGLRRRGRVLVSAIEHHAVLAALERLQAEGFATELLPVDARGRVDPDAFARSLGPETLLASVIYANNEIGTVQPVAELARIAHQHGVLFHTDAIAAPQWLSIDVGELGVDLLSLSAHKFAGPHGVGLLYARSGVPIAPVLHGGGQEFGRRSGTENVAGIAGMAAALESAVAERSQAYPRVEALRDRLEAGIRSAVSDVNVNGAGAARLPNLLSAGFGGVDAAALLIRLDLAGIAVSAGSACTSGSPEPSHVLAALGVEPHWRDGSIRFSLGTRTTQAEIDRVLEVLPAVVGELRQPVVGQRGGMGRLETNGARLEAEA
ncbi:MAG: cysteine desulfurase family protein [Candidatus Baltobacteraceae bacterium]